VTLRIAAALSLFLGTATLLGYFHVLGKTPWASAEARHLRAMKDRTTAPRSPEAVPFAELARLPRHLPLAERARLERRGVVVEGYVQRMLRAVDGDLHLDVTAESPGASGPLQHYAVAEITPSWRARFGSYDRLVEALRPRIGGAAAWEREPRRVRLTGWLLYDFPHERRALRRRYPAALGAWEVHPVTRLEVWDEALGRFREHTP